MLVEVAGTLSLLPSPVVKTSLFVVWGGPNDFFQQPPGSGSPSTAAQNIVTIVDDLLGAGARHILVPGMPDLSLTPEFHGSAAAQAFSQSFNSALQSSLPAGVFYFDTYGFMHNIVNHPQDFEFTNVTTPCLTGPPYSVCGNTQVQSEYLFWDGVHPTTTAASFLAAEFEKTVVPEPSTLIMLSTAIAGLAGVLRRKISA
jgi:phospholipase/lecithinase/hemolysin